MRKIFLLPMLSVALTLGAQANRHNSETILRGAEAHREVAGTSVLRYKPFSAVPAYIEFQENSRIAFGDWQAWMTSRYFKGNDKISFALKGHEKDQLGMEHFRYYQTSQGYALEFGVWIVHVKNGTVVSMNGELFDTVPEFTPALGESEALAQAVAHVGAVTYKWEVPAEEAYLKAEQNDPTATYFPEGKLVIVNSDPSLAEVDLKLAWKFDIYAHQPMTRAWVFVDASNGATVFETDRIHHADSNGTAQTNYNGSFNLVADWTGTNFRLRENGRGNGIRTLNCNLAENNPSDFTDGNNIWNGTGLDQCGPDGHFGAEKTYDFFYNYFGRNSIDDNGFELISWVNFGNGYQNAFWNGQRMTYGAGSGNNNPFTTLDIAGHEISHGLTEHTADLVYSYESGALNESFSDIFGTAIEFYTLGMSGGDWMMGEDMGSVIRYINNPNLAGNPDTYLGQYWFTGAGDNGGVHYNSGVQNFWFYLLTMGGSGTNDLGNNYSVTGIGIEQAQSIAFRNLTVYLTSSSQYTDARFYALQSAMDLFGPCSPQIIATGNAWYAVGVGSPYSAIITADFSASSNTSCVLPFNVQFSDLSSNTTTWSWAFGDGATSTQPNPSHTYTTAGTYTVVLNVSSNCGTDTETKTAYIEVGPDVPCDYTMPQAGKGVTQDGCEGYLYDNGGPSGNYLSQSKSYVTIAPRCAVNVTLHFDEFDVEEGGICQYDALTIYDGPSTSSPLIGKYCNTTPPPASITSTGKEITVEFKSDQAVEESGFKISWECQTIVGVPSADFSTASEPDCNGTVNFTDLSENCPDTYLWNFGDGYTSTEREPLHIYGLNGTYNVTLTVTNANGTDSVVKTSFITISREEGPEVEDVEICPGESATLTATAAVSGDNFWFDTYNATVPFHTGNTYTTPILQNRTTYYVETMFEGNLTENVGPSDNTFGSGGYYNFNLDQYLVFDAYRPFILKKVKVYSSVAGLRTIELRDADGNIMESYSVLLQSGVSALFLNFKVPIGTDYQLGLSPDSVKELYRNNGGVTYPYEIEGLVSIKRSSSEQNGGLDHYYFFYDWEVAPYCSSERVPVAASTWVCTGVDELTGNPVSVFPNPNSGLFQVTWQSDDVRTITLLNQHGQVVYTETPSTQGTTTIHAPLAKGVYFLSLQGDKASITKKVVVQ